jgi:dihydrodiol dehydrogenase / D-xylose 1-dehydrogenase (NADP)
MRWGILGSGKIASDFATALKTVPGAELQAVASRRTGPADEFAARFGMPQAFSGSDAYTQLATSGEVDICYIATLNPSHKSDAIACLEAGKHVVVEKPMALSLDDAKEMVDAARRNNRFLMEGMWTRFFPAVRHARKLIAEGAIGSVVHVQSDFGFMCDEPDSSRMFSKLLGGGGLLDIGCYTIDAATCAFGGQAPASVTATGVLGETGVDVSGNLIVDYRGGGSAGLLYSLRAQTEEATTIWGTHGTIKLHSPAHCPSKLTVQQWDTPSRAGAGELETLEFPLPSTDEQSGTYNYPNQQGFCYQIQAVEDVLANPNGKIYESPEYTHAEMLANAATLEAARIQMGYLFDGETDPSKQAEGCGDMQLTAASA